MSSSPEGPDVNSPAPSIGSRRFFSRLLQVFFNHPFLYMLPAVAIAFAGLYSGLSRPSEYQSAGTVSVAQETFLGSLSDLRGNDFRYGTPATVTSRQFNELMQTAGFSSLVAATAGLNAALQSGTYSMIELRSSVYAVATGESLMTIVASSQDPATAQRTAEAAIATFKQWVTDTEIGGSNAAEEFFDKQLRTYQVEVDAAAGEFEAYVLANPAPLDPRDERDTAEQLEIQRLDKALIQAQSRFDTALDKRDAAQQATQESSADIDQRLQILDPPGVPSLPQTGLRALAIYVVLFAVLGGLVTLAAVALGASLSRTVLSAADLQLIGIPVIAVLPEVKKLHVDVEAKPTTIERTSDYPRVTELQS